ncbi:hypothetical protein [Kitasatospora sp. NPDC050543]|uniref:hypothetical protein n=1 Tax=Kitasatospora sp. NPDC050543 TaxID=3364054 RepID=UPI0037AA4589
MYRRGTRRARMLSGCISPHLVSRLLELGHAEEIEFQARRGEWLCAWEWARLLGGQGRQREALEVLAPYVATGRWRAAETTAELLERWGEGRGAIALARTCAEDGERSALEFFARLLARHGRGDEAFALLRPHIEDWFLAEAWSTSPRDGPAPVRAGRPRSVQACEAVLRSTLRLGRPARMQQGRGGDEPDRAAVPARQSLPQALGMCCLDSRERLAVPALTVERTRQIDLQDREEVILPESGRFPTFTKVLGAFEDGYDLRLDALFEFGLKALLDGLTSIVEGQEAVV